MPFFRDISCDLNGTLLRIDACQWATLAALDNDPTVLCRHDIKS
jgi:hypothetical protein